MKGMICDHELEITEEAIIERTEYSETKSFWNVIERIEENENFAFIYIMTNAAHVIPKDRILDGDYHVFILKAKEYMEKQN